MNGFITRVRQPVKRERAEQYVLITLFSFAVTVIMTRLFLELTGYPQLGGGGLHIAHVLWGGLLLFAGSLLPLILANREVYVLGALSSGIGVGLFIDEVGKFITATNDYFYPAAAPIIYVFFLLTVLVYTHVRRPPSRDARAELYRSLEALSEVLDHDLQPRERDDLEERLRQVERVAEHPEQARLASALREFVAADSIRVAKETPGWWRAWQARVAAFEARWVRQLRLRVVLAVGLAITGVVALMSLIPVAFVVLGLLTAEVRITPELVWLILRLALAAVVGIPLVAGALLLVAGRDRRGIEWGAFGLIFSLTVVHILNFYVEQFQAVISAMIQFGLLIGVQYYRHRYLSE